MTLNLDDIDSSNPFLKAIEKEYNNPSDKWQKIREHLVQIEITGKVEEKDRQDFTELIRPLSGATYKSEWREIMLGYPR